MERTKHNWKPADGDFKPNIPKRFRTRYINKRKNIITTVAIILISLLVVLLFYLGY